jgi:hypothetical protein
MTAESLARLVAFSQLLCNHLVLLRLDVHVLALKVVVFVRLEHVGAKHEHDLEQ